jgi:hypothetical protein
VHAGLRVRLVIVRDDIQDLEGIAVDRSRVPDGLLRGDNLIRCRQ